MRDMGGIGKKMVPLDSLELAHQYDTPKTPIEVFFTSFRCLVRNTQFIHNFAVSK